MKNSILLIVLLFAGNTTLAQTVIWSEDFSSYADGAVTGANNNTTNPSPDWNSSGCSTCPLATTDWWEVRSGVMEASNVNDEHVSLISEVINITGFPAIYFEVDCMEQGDLEGLYLGADNCFNSANQDYADIEYSIDGGFWTLIQNAAGWCGLYASCGAHTFYGDDNSDGDCRTVDTDWVSQTVQVLGLSGTTLQFRLSATNSDLTEYIQFDNISVVGYVPLPIELTRFEANQNGNTVELTWHTSSELNNESFIIERTDDGISWEEIHQEPGAGNSNTELNYSTIDKRPLFGMSYYRLKQTDFDGNFGYSDIQSVDFKNTDLNISMFPNPASRSVHFGGEHLEGASLIIRNEFGQICLESIHIESSHTTVDISDLSKGIYHVHLNNSGQTVTKKLVVLH